MEAVRHAADAGDWTLAASMVLEDFAINCLIELRDNESITLASIFHRVPEDLAGNQLPLLLVAAALEHSACADDAGGVSLARAEDIVGRLPAGDEIPARLAAALIRMAGARRAGDLKAAIAASARAEEALGAISEGVLALHPGLRPQVLLGRGIVEFWAGQADQAAATLRASAAAASAPASSRERADCLGQLSLVEALQGNLNSAEMLAGETGAIEEGRMQPRIPAASTALACPCVLERYGYGRRMVS